MTNSAWTRRRITAALAATIPAAALGRNSARAAESKSITVLNWQGYGTDEPFGLKAFAYNTGIEVKHDYFNSEPEMLTKLRTNPGAYDVVLVNSARDAQAQSDGLIDPVDLAQIPNAQGIAEAFKTNRNLLIDGHTYGVPWVWGMNALAVRQDKAATIDSYAVFQNPAYANRGALFDDAVTEVAIAALLTNQDINDPTDLKQITATLKSFKKDVKLTWSSEDQWNRAFAGGAFDISVFWSGAITRAVNVHHQPVEFIIPKEGAIGWLDNLCIPSSSTKKHAGLAFISYMVDPDFYVQWAKHGAPASASNAAMAKLPPDDMTRQIHDPARLQSLQFMGALPEERRQSFNDLWEEVKAYYATS